MSSRSCYSCGETGHQARECSKGQRCYNCQKFGHLSQNCTEPTAEKVCYKCNEPGHVAQSCPSSKGDGRDSSHGKSRGDNDDRGRYSSFSKDDDFKSERSDRGNCFKCSRPGHIARDCRYESSQGYSSGGGGSFGSTCYTCGERGHRARDCQGESKCYNCGKTGHISRDCDQPSGQVCYGCGNPGHIKMDCPNL
ncbi:hypothetical protein DSO57_1019057 [Entomophthora muscae]|uniref:Uncharacterized protein n=1 Tax=Entomophthora muscae TaxID=34485 RepID=A0ACC2U235_9FUNG|nr:hypothetical protein DSO57_1019057 [Entomophthora muscae]